MSANEGFRRVIVAQPRPVAVGVVRWFSPAPIATVVVKATFGFGGTGLELVDPQPGLAIDRTKGDELIVAGDFAPFKEGVDVVVVGHAYTQLPSRRIDARVAIGAWERRFTAIGPARADRIALRQGQVLDAMSLATGVGPERSGAPEREPGTLLHHDPRSPMTIYNVAPAAQRLATAPAPGAPIALDGLSRRGEQRFAFPEIAPFAWFDLPESTLLRVPLTCDTLWFDTDRETLAVLWRGQVSVVSESLPEVERLVVAMSVGEPEDDAVSRELPRATFSYAAEATDPSSEAHGEEEADELRLARYDAFDCPIAPEPTTTLDQYARVTAELAEDRAPRADVLARHGFDEDGWLLEDRAWLERIADRAIEGDGSLAADFGERFVEAQRAFVTDAERDRTLDEYADATVALESGKDPMDVLRARGLSIPAWARLEQRFEEAMKADPALAAAFEARCDTLRALQDKPSDGTVTLELAGGPGGRG